MELTLDYIKKLAEYAFENGLMPTPPNYKVLEIPSINYKQLIDNGSEETVEGCQRYIFVENFVTDWGIFNIRVYAAMRLPEYKTNNIVQKINETDPELDELLIGHCAHYVKQKPSLFLGKNDLHTESVSGKIGRNEKCPCDSGKKFKKCCGKN